MCENGKNRVGTIEFYDNLDMKLSLMAKEWAYSMLDLDNHIRGIVRDKTHIGEFSEEFIEGLEYCRKTMLRIMNGNGVSFEDLY